LKDLGGSPAGVLYASGFGGARDLNIEGALGDDKIMMDCALSGSPATNAVTFLFLEPGLYDVYVYCWAGSLLGRTDYSILAFTGA
jgi:hypothetical protein